MRSWRRAPYIHGGRRRIASAATRTPTRRALCACATRRDAIHTIAMRSAHSTRLDSTPFMSCPKGRATGTELDSRSSRSARAHAASTCARRRPPPPPRSVRVCAANAAVPCASVLRSLASRTPTSAANFGFHCSAPALHCQSESAGGQRGAGHWQPAVNSANPYGLRSIFTAFVDKKAHSNATAKFDNSVMIV